MRYKIESSGNGAVWTITRLSDGASVCLQGDDAIYFGRKLESTTESYTDDDVCDEYEGVLVSSSGGCD